MSRILLLVLSCAVLLKPFGAAAQVWDEYPLFIEAKTFAPMPLADGGEVVETTLLRTGFDTNEGDIQLPFPITFDGQEYNQLRVFTDGYVIFGQTTSTNVPDNTAVPSTTGPNRALFLFHDDLVLDLAPRYQLVERDESREFVIEWQGIRKGTSTFRFKMQLWLTEGSPLLRVHYLRVSASGSGTAVTGSMGVENSTGARGTPGLSPTGVNCSPNCNDLAFPDGYVYQYGSSLEPDVVVGSLTVGTVLEEDGGSRLRLPITASVRNIGRQSITGIGWDYYLSGPGGFRPTDRVIEPGHPEIETIAPLGSVSATDLRFTDMPAIGEYRVCAVVNPAEVPEANPSNNVGCSGLVRVGPDLLPVSVAFQGTTTATPGQVVTIAYSIKNTGTRRSGSFGYELLLSERPSGGNGTSIYVGTAPALDPGQTYDASTQVRIPPNLIGAEFYPEIAVNLEKGTPEATLDNNRLRGTSKLTMSTPDLVASALGLSAPCFFGKELKVSYRVCNNGKATASNFAETVYLHSPGMTGINVGSMSVAGSTPEICSTDWDCTAMNQGACILERVNARTVGICHYGCVGNEECGTELGLVCTSDWDLPGRKSCQNVLAVSQCRTVERTIVVPELDHEGLPLEENKDYVFAVLVDPTNKLNEGGKSETSNNNIARTPSVQCRFPAPDFRAGDVAFPSRVAAGETAAFHRIIENLGNEAGAISYRFVLTTNEIGSREDIALPLVSTGGDGKIVLAPGQVNSRTDLVTIPSTLESRLYYLALVLDPDRETYELDKLNNSLVVGQVWVEPSVLQVRNLVLPVGTVGQEYHHQLAASGGTGRYLWSGRNLPDFLSLSEGGVLRATRLPDDGQFSFWVRVMSDGVYAEAPVVLDVIKPRGPLALLSTVLPPAYTHSTSSYYSPIAISGGLPPYRCTYDGLPHRFGPASDVDSCALFANNNLETPGEHRFKVIVVDANKARVEGELQLSIQHSTVLYFSSLKLEDGFIGQENYQSCVRSGPSKFEDPEDATAVRYEWSMEGTPRGLSVESRGNEGCLVGSPLECGTFMIRVGVQTRLSEDGAVEESNEGLASLTIECREVSLVYEPIPALYRGDSLDVQLRATGPSADQATFLLGEGRLPDGITLEASGRLHGRVGDQAEYGSYSFTIKIDDGAGGYGPGAVALVVQPRKVEPEKRRNEDGSRCSTAGDSPAEALPFATALLALVGLGARRRVGKA